MASADPRAVRCQTEASAVVVALARRAPAPCLHASRASGRAALLAVSAAARTLPLLSVNARAAAGVPALGARSIRVGYAGSEHARRRPARAGPTATVRCRRCVETGGFDQWAGVVLVHDVGRNSAAVRDLEALAAGPLADLGAAVAAGAAGAGAAATRGAAADPTTGADVLGEVVLELGGVLLRQVDLVVRRRPGRT